MYIYLHTYIYTYIYIYTYTYTCVNIYRVNPPPVLPLTLPRRYPPPQVPMSLDAKRLVLGARCEISQIVQVTNMYRESYVTPVPIPILVLSYSLRSV